MFIAKYKNVLSSIIYISKILENFLSINGTMYK